MRRRPARGGTAFCMALMVTAAVLIQMPRTRAEGQNAQDPLPDAPARQTVIIVCGACHDVDTAIGMRHTTGEWKQVVDSMINRGAVASEEEFKAVLAYLSRSFGLVNVNTAPAKEIEDVLEVSSRDAEAIVRQRMERGAFTSLDELKMVPGVDAPAIEKRKERIQFKGSRSAP